MSKKIKTPYGTFNICQLREAFNAVENKENWKMEILAVIPAEDFEVTAAAIEFYTGSKTSFWQGIPGKVVVQAPGYYLSVGA